MHKVESAYLGDLPYSADGVRPNKAEQAKGRLTIWQKSDRLIVATKLLLKNTVVSLQLLLLCQLS